MEKQKLSEFVSFIPGINQSRAEKQFGDQEINYYDQSSFDEDDKHHGEMSRDEKFNYLFDSEVSLDKRDVVISNSLQRATMVSEKNIGKVLSLNFTKVEFHSEKLDKRYFLYLFNQYKDIQRQKERELQGTGPVQRLTKQSLEQLVIPVVSSSEQQRIGEIYIETLKIQSKLSQYARLTEQFAGSILEKSLEG
ncbi:restriction endonuclease subunit S [Enterococcus faecium]|uniref:restriction endonuclease subunit S n=1 Tax=Enterococcus faecium TaxID=1352 RepID=UPI000CF2EADA|nr:restriction endonuclease subunit S [Enterococcus faecium]EGP4984430.1 restriction endonuclease subunit S [Enterococcus faecium]EGP5086796.1 restriction endonuclease subunit S [Enterococcus faecium]EGP5140258.1 restriction endonuclease subunit S [Enterococcus faecium]EGP5178202.1 restriction endonuclease subunit S [Enterococcus faecium]EME3546022.1 restriction endonuclease subunit S [Enterococcus faecium]